MKSTANSTVKSAVKDTASDTVRGATRVGSGGRRGGPARRPPARRPGRESGGRRHELAAHIFMTPWLVGLLAVTALPMLASLYLAFTDYDILSRPAFIGVENFARLLEDDRFWNSVRVTLTYVLVSVPLQLAFALLLALVLDKGLRGLTIYRSAYYLPSLLGTSVAVAVLWRQIFGHDGLVNQVLGMVGVEGTNWLQNPQTALGTLIVLNVWTFGSPMVIFLAGLRQIPEELYESARVDGAPILRQFGSITIPLLTPIIFFNVILQTIGAFQSFTQAHIVSGGTGGPNDSTLFYTLYIYQQAFVNFDMGYASALAWVLLAVIALITAVHFALSRYWVFYGE